MAIDPSLSAGALRAQRVEAAKLAIQELMQRNGFIDQFAEIAVKRVLDRELSDRHTEEHIGKIIAAGWHAERRRLFVAGAEWAERMWEESKGERPRGFYHLMAAAADDVARGGP